MTKKINVSQYVIIPKNTGKDTKSDELLENLNSVSAEDIKSIWDEIDGSKEEIARLKEKKEREEKIARLREIANKMDKKYRSEQQAEDLEKMHEEIDKKICMVVYDILQYCKWTANDIVSSANFCLSVSWGIFSDVEKFITNNEWGKLHLFFSPKDNSGLNIKFKVVVKYKFDDSDNKSTNYTISSRVYPKSCWSSWRSEWPVVIFYWNNEGKYDCVDYSSELLEEKKKIYKTMKEKNA